jgi:hypothetical protein
VPVRRGLAALAGLLVLWFTFYAVGRGLLAIPSEWHEGAVWRRNFFQAIEEAEVEP